MLLFVNGLNMNNDAERAIHMELLVSIQELVEGSMG